METWAVIPVKSLRQTKSRLASVLTVQQRGALTQLLLRRTLTVLAATPTVQGVVVVTQDATVAQLAQGHGADVVAEPVDAQLNGAVQVGVRQVRARRGTQALILPSDLPLLTPAAVTALITSVSPPVRMAICSDERQQGTNGLIVPTAVSFQFQYGKSSFWRHLREAERQRLPLCVLAHPHLQFDLDTPEDWRVLSCIENVSFSYSQMHGIVSSVYHNEGVQSSSC